MIITVRAPRRLDFDISLPASKSISARVLVMNALANRPAILKNISDCDDTTALISALSTDKPRHSEPDSPRQCEPATPRHCEERSNPAQQVPRHCEERSNPAPANLNSQFSILNSKLDIGPAGTAMRFLTAYYASCPVTDVILTGSERMKNRPIALLVDALRQLGADISYTEKEGYPPLHIRGRRLQGGEISLDGGVSSQYISALLMTAPVMTDGLTLHLTGDIISQPYINLTLSLMRQFGIETAETNETGNPENSSNALNSANSKNSRNSRNSRNSKNKEQLRTTKINNQTYSPPAVFTVESDWSAASYWYEIAALSHDAGTKITLRGLLRDSLQGDAAIVGLFDRLGVHTEFTPDGVRLTKKSLEVSDNKCLEYDFMPMPDMAQTVAVTCCMLGVPFRFTGLQSLRIKETDRIQALRNELLKLGYLLEAEGDSVLMWDGSTTVRAPDPVIETYNDHRMAMSFAPAALLIPEGVSIRDPEVVTKSYPTFWRHLQQSGFQTTDIASPETIQKTDAVRHCEARSNPLPRHCEGAARSNPEKTLNF